MQRIIAIAALPNGAHKNQTFHGTLPDGWAVVPEDMELENYPFGVVTAKEVIHHREVEVVRDVTKTREVESFDEEGNPITVTEEYTEQEWVTEQEPYGVMTVTGWKPLPMPEHVPVPVPAAEPTVWDELDAAYQEGVNGAYDQ